MIVVWLLFALAVLVAVWALLELRTARQKTAKAERALKAAHKAAERMRDAYAQETRRLELLFAGSDDDRFRASLDILRTLSRGANGGD